MLWVVATPPSLLAPTGVHRQDSVLLSLFALARSVLGTLFLSRAAEWAMCNQWAVPTHHLLPFLVEEVKDIQGSF